MFDSYFQSELDLESSLSAPEPGTAVCLLRFIMFKQTPCVVESTLDYTNLSLPTFRLHSKAFITVRLDAGLLGLLRQQKNDGHPMILTEKN